MRSTSEANPGGVATVVARIRQFGRGRDPNLHLNLHLPECGASQSPESQLVRDTVMAEPPKQEVRPRSGRGVWNAAVPVM